MTGRRGYPGLPNWCEIGQFDPGPGSCVFGLKEVQSIQKQCGNSRQYQKYDRRPPPNPLFTQRASGFLLTGSRQEATDEYHTYQSRRREKTEIRGAEVEPAKESEGIDQMDELTRPVPANDLSQG